MCENIGEIGEHLERKIGEASKCPSEDRPEDAEAAQVGLCPRLF